MLFLYPEKFGFFYFAKGELIYGKQIAGIPPHVGGGTAPADGQSGTLAVLHDNSLADLYDPLTMPVELSRAHTANDKAVMAAYGFSTKMTEADCVAELMKLYQKKVAELV